jgi:hypothetical protein
MPLLLPTLDDRNFEQLLAEAKRRIPAFTPEWTNFEGESDPGVTIVQLFAFLTENLLYRANRIPERNRLKFLQLLDLPLRPASPAEGIVQIRNERGPIAPRPLGPGVVVSAGQLDFLTRDPVNVLPIEARAYVKRPIPPTDPEYATYLARFEAVLAAEQAADEEDGGTTTTTTSTQLAFYEPSPVAPPTPGNPRPVLDLVNGTIDRSVYLALLAPENVDPEQVRAAIANQTLSLGVVPALDGTPPPLRPRRLGEAPDATADLAFEVADVRPGDQNARWAPLRMTVTPDVLAAMGIVQAELPGVTGLQTWSFDDPLDEGTLDYPPRLEDEQIVARLVTWVRVRLRGAESTTSGAAGTTPSGRLTWIGVNATRVYQAVPVRNELVGFGTGEPDQVFGVANVPVLPVSIRVVVEEPDTGEASLWRLTDDLTAAGRDERVFELDPEAGTIRFGALNGSRPRPGSRILASYEYGGGLQGNVTIGAIDATADDRLQGGFTIANPIPTSGGDLGEGIEEAERQLPLVLRHRDRLVTVQDFGDVTRRTPGVDIGRVEVLPLFRPSQPATEAPGAVTVLVVPRFDPVRPLWPTPDRLFLQRVCDHLEPRRLVTTEVYVRGPDYVPVYVSIGIRVRAGSFPDLVKGTVRDSLSLYLSALPFGGPEGAGWPLNKRLMRKDLEAVATRVPGVEFVEGIQMGVGSPADVAEDDVSGLELPVLVGIDVTEGPPEPLANLFGAPSALSSSGVRIVPVPVSRATC